MAGNTIGQIFRLTTFGESHGSAIGGVIDGCPPDIRLDEKFIADEMSLRSPGKGAFSSKRKEDDKVEFISGVFEGKTTGTPLAFIIKNSDQAPSDYDDLKDLLRPSHADFSFLKKFGIYDHRGGGRASARETAVRVAAGAISKLILLTNNISVHAFTSKIGKIDLKDGFIVDTADINNDPLHCPDPTTSLKMQKLLEKIQKEGDSIGGIVSCFIKNCPSGLGEPVFDKLQAELAKAMLSIPAAKGFEYGDGFAVAEMTGSEHNDTYESLKGKISFATNHAGGILGGISTGEDIFFSVAFKPVSSISKEQRTVTFKGKETTISVKGRHDVCVVPRAVAVVEAMAAIVLTDHLLRLKTIK